jgi:acyl transferase domain-containing protein
MRELAHTHCPELVAQAEGELGVDPLAHMDEGTLYLQPAVYLGSLAHWRAAGEPCAAFAVGHSLGEMAALTAAGVFSPAEGMRLVLARAAAMQQAGEAAEPGGLLAVFGRRDAALALCRDHGLTVAADNEPSQLVASGPLGRLDAARREARPRGLKGARLAVPAALHSEAMRPAVEPFRRALRAAELGPARMRVIANVSARPFEDPARELPLGVVSCVRFRQSVLALRRAGVSAYAEMGDTGILTGLVSRTLAAA